MPRTGLSLENAPCLLTTHKTRNHPLDHKPVSYCSLAPNWAGKTTLLRQLVGLLRPTSGSISLFGGELTGPGGPERVTRMVSYATQRAGALADLTAAEALRITGHLRGMSREAAEQQARRLSGEFSLDAFGGRPLGKLSGGEQRLVGFCMSLMADRPVIIFDEPTNDLDPSHRRQVWDKMMSINRTLNTTIILVTHNVIEAEKVLERVGIINHGEIVALGTVGELKARVDQRVRLEFRLRDQDQDPAAALGLGPEVDLLSMGRGLWRALVDQGSLGSVLTRLASGAGLAKLDGFRILLPNLEDVYLQLGGGERLVA